MKHTFFFFLIAASICILLVVGVLAYALWYDSKKDQEWETFLEAHKCQLTMKIAPIMFHGFPIPKQNCYLCDDNITYCRAKE